MPRVVGVNGAHRTVLSNNNSSDDEAPTTAAPVRVGGRGRPPAAPAWQAPVKASAPGSSSAAAAAGGYGGGGGDYEGGSGGGGMGGGAANALFEKYLQEGGVLGDDLGKDQLFEAGLSRVRDHLTHVDSSCCLICLNHIRPTEAVWHCGKGCHTVLHLVCIQEWARSQLDAAGAKAAARLSQFPAAADEARAVAEWACPKCRAAYAATEVPREYKCFCGKATDPVFDPWVAAHSCGEVCGRALPSQCGHECLLLCHPGPCPPCPRVVDAACYCGRKSLRRRCGHHEYSCEGICGKVLECGHRCPDVCHPGDCAPCPRPGTHACLCGSEKRQLPCGQRVWQCARVCGKALQCGNHSCTKVCHSGPCGDCPLSGARTCPCGKARHDDLSCSDRVPTCGETCGKLLPCGVHRCADRCHHGDCTVTCRGPAIKTCRCGRSSKEVLCFQDFTCERRCTELRACGRHPCKRRCCDGNCPPCEEVCNRWLKCRNHRCPAPCHAGPCQPCPLTTTITCACGAAHCTLPCGAEARAEAPACSRPCSVPRICRHAPTLPPHRCHFGPCPPCAAPCATPLTCGHACASRQCHDPPPPPVPDFVQPAPPKAASAQAKEQQAGGGRDRGGGSAAAAGGPPVREATALAAQMLAVIAASGELPSACPACQVPVPVTCVGGHGSRGVPCCGVAPYSCGAACGRPLACGNHACDLPCHAVAPPGVAATSHPLAPRPCRQCDRRCSRARGCAHPCPNPCHPGPCPRCEAPSRTPCLCGKSSLTLPCCELLAATATASAKMAAAMGRGALSCGKPCHRQLAHCPHPCRALCHSGACPNPGGCGEEVTVRCACPLKRKAKWSCSAVQQELERQGRGRAWDATTQLRLLPCDAECEKARAKDPQGAGKDEEDEEEQVAQQVSKGQRAAAAAKGKGKEQMAAGAGRGLVAAAAGAGSGSTGSLREAGAGGGAAGEAGGKGGKAKLNRAEREALAAEKEAARKRQEAVRGVVRGAVLAVLAGLVVLLGVVVKRLLVGIDAALRTDA